MKRLFKRKKRIIPDRLEDPKIVKFNDDDTVTVSKAHFQRLEREVVHLREERLRLVAFWEFVERIAKEMV